MHTTYCLLADAHWHHCLLHWNDQAISAGAVHLGLAGGPDVYQYRILRWRMRRRIWRRFVPLLIILIMIVPVVFILLAGQ